MSTAQTIDISQAKSISEAMEMSELNWSAAPVELVTSNGLDVYSHKAVIREDNNRILGIVGSSYKIVQNNYAFSYLDAILDAYPNTSLSTATLIDGGRQVILKAIIDGGMIIRQNPDGSDDEIVKEISLFNGFDGSVSLMQLFTVSRLVCTNGMRADIKEATVKLRHSVNVETKANQALLTMGKSIKFFEKFERNLKELAQKDADKKMVDEFLKEMFGDSESTRTKNNKEAVMNAFNSGMGNGGGTAYDLYNGYLEYLDHERGNDENKRLASNLIGGGAWNKEKALKVINNLVTA